MTKESQAEVSESVPIPDEELLARIRIYALGDLYFFAKGVLGFDRLHPRIHKPLCRLLELYKGHNASLVHPWKVYEKTLRWVFARAGVPEETWPERLADIKANGIKKLLILMPRGWYKTTLVSIAYSAWRGVRNPNVRCLLAQNTSTNAKAKGSALGSSITSSALLRVLFPSIMPSPVEKWSEDGRCLRRSGNYAESTYEFAGVRTQVTSRHFNLIVEDDTVAPDKDDLGEDSVLPSKADVSQAIGWHRLVPSLFDEAEFDQNVIVGTRWYVRDFLAWVMEHEPAFIVFQWAAKETDARPDIRGKLMWPERFGEKVLAGIAASQGPYLFSSLYLNSPVQADNMLFRAEWIRYYDVEPPRLMTFTTVDLGGDPTDTKGPPDYNVVMTCGKDMHEGKIYVLEYARERCSPSKVLDLLWEQVRKWHPVTTGIETTAYQKSLLHWIRQRQVTTGMFFAVTPLSHSRIAKAARIRGLQPAFAGGLMYLRAYMDALVNELLVYPLGTNDDLIDALAMQLELWRVSPSHQESAVASEGGPNDFDTVMAMARQQQAKMDAAGTDHRPTPAWGMSIPSLVFDGGVGSGVDPSRGFKWN